MKKIAIVLLNLGGPDKKESIRPFLFNFFTDKNIIRAPYPVRWCLANFIAWRRTKKEAGESYGELGDRSPLLENSTAQAKALEARLNQDKNTEYKSFICMRYWHPMSDQVVQEVKSWDADEIILLPLYPQFSTTTTRSSFQEWDKSCKDHGLDKPTTEICCYPWDDGFIHASVDNIIPIYTQAQQETGKKPRMLFSAHGLPESVIKEGDPYQWQCEQSAEKMAALLSEKLGITDLDWQICYQSRVGPQKWIGPSTEEALEHAAHDQVPVVILPHAFTQEHVETLVEIEIEYREEAEKMGLLDFYRVPTVGTNDIFIKGLADLVKQHQGALKTVSHTAQPLCPNDFADCCMRVRNKEGA